MNDRKSKFLSAVQILAPHDQFIHKAAQRIPAEQLPAYPGAAALEFVVAVQKLRQPLQDLQIRATKNKQRSGSVGRKTPDFRCFTNQGRGILAEIGGGG